jgi:peptidoglycan/xylan/chitin deacetylase (PgdA/CDA1 family)
MVRQRSERFLPELRRRRFYLNGEEIREMLASGLVSFGAHGYNHDPLTWFSGRELEDQLKRPRDMLEKLTGKPVISFSYPHSLFKPEVLVAAEEAGYQIGFQSADPCHVINTAEYQSLALTRVPILHDLSTSPTGRFSPSMFNCQLKGIIY